MQFLNVIWLKIKKYRAKRAFLNRHLRELSEEWDEEMAEHEALERERQSYNKLIASLPDYDNLAPVTNIEEVYKPGDYAPVITITIDNENSYVLLKPDMYYVEYILFIRTQDMPNLNWEGDPSAGYGTGIGLSGPRKQLFIDIKGVGKFYSQVAVVSRSNSIGLSVMPAD